MPETCWIPRYLYLERQTKKSKHALNHRAKKDKAPKETTQHHKDRNEKRERSSSSS